MKYYTFNNNEFHTQLLSTFVRKTIIKFLPPLPILQTIIFKRQNNQFSDPFYIRENALYNYDAYARSNVICSVQTQAELTTFLMLCIKPFLVKTNRFRSWTTTLFLLRIIKIK